ncbi:hypothetical protein BCR35DRAFT_351194 [Leucosporidium creatinivorum]|uniref:NAD(P)-binding domain-containing protein n=1 Tax=Leucosporidium creatinivorum TaxID=106004 RepID=A0A1Y2FXZ0_9BASI|nr:hypothetical protein BCR35DRAFT_351194 [Leucosporidium creatinivorum]
MLANKHILVFGATGGTGLLFVQKALSLSSPPQLTLYVRSLGKLPAGIEENTRVRIVVGELNDRAKVEEAMEGVDTVTSFLGAYPDLNAFIAMFTRSKATPIADSFKTVTDVMKAKGVKRILVLSTPNTFIPGDQRNWTWAIYLAMIRALIPSANAEMSNMARLVVDPSFDYTVFRVPHLNDLDTDQKVWAGLLGPEWKGTRELSRGSLAKWVLGEVEKGEWIKGAPALGNYK